MASSLGALDHLRFDNRFTRELPADDEVGSRRRQVREACYSRVEPTAVAAPELIASSKEMADLLGFSDEAVGSSEFADALSGNLLIDGMDPFAMCYGGHQFGNWAGQLGDGRAIALGEVLDRGDQHQTLQLKGPGLTPYSRTADGRAVLRSSVREFLCSEAMAHLGVPTTRALSLTLTGDKVVRDMFYDGHPRPELGAVVCRVAPSFVRFGSFEIFASRGEIDVLRQLVDFTVRNDFPDLVDSADAADGELGPATYLAFYREVVQRTAEMIVHWMRVGFVHGVMNTDNLSILGLTIDYGPYGWLENYDPNWTPNTTDAQHHRYRYGAQPAVAHWNLMQLANALHPLIDDVDALQEALNSYVTIYEQRHLAMMRSKLGLTAAAEVTEVTANDSVAAVDAELLQRLESVLQLAETDMTIFYRALGSLTVEELRAAGGSLPAALADAYYVADQLTDEVVAEINDWLVDYGIRLGRETRSDAERHRAMAAVNPKYVLRNYMAQLAIDESEQGNHDLIHELLDLLRSPYDEQPARERWAAKRPDWARDRPGCSQLSCSS